MTAVRKKWLTVTILAAMATACGDSGGSNESNPPPVTPDSGAAKDASSTAGGNDAAPGMLPGADACGSRADGTPLDTSAAGGCYYFYCYLDEANLRSEATAGGACANDVDVAIQCEGESVRTVAECARENGIALAGGNRQVVVDCARKNKKLDKFSDACLTCNIESSYCAAKNCLTVCVSGDSVECDKCREENDCTPDFYTCAGLPNPLK